MPKIRLDQLLVSRGLFPSREQAKRALLARAVEVEGRRDLKPGSLVAEDVVVEVVAQGEPFVSRAGRKLDAALQAFALQVEDWVCLDVGASTGGFTHCLLERGASRVYALDVGYGQLDFKLRQDPRVVVRERVNARFLQPEDLPEKVQLATVDVSFISLLKIVPALLPLIIPEGFLLPLIKPQFEVGRDQVGKGGIVRDPDLREAIVAQRCQQLQELGLELLGSMDSPIKGAEGNLEALALFKKQGSE
jgi:23S rRNA (cytidine1920-2'-O)/16S rRNA (cytidine1409-2'-O)-methyltransferase